MQVEGGLEPLRVDFGQEGLRVVEEIPVPGIAGPAHAFARFVLSPNAPRRPRPGLVPVHVDDHHVDGQSAVTELLPQGDELLVGIIPVSAPPVAEDELRRHRNLPCHLREIGQGRLVIMPIGKQVPVLDLPLRAGRHPFAPVGILLHEQMARALVHEGPAVAGQDAELHRIVVVDMVGAGASVQRTGRAHQVARGRVPGMPGDNALVHPKVHDQVLRREFPPAPIGQLKGRSLDPDALPGTGRTEFRNRQVPVHDGEGGMVLELTVLRPLHPDQPVGQDSEPGIPDDNLRLRACHGIILGEKGAGNK